MADEELEIISSPLPIIFTVDDDDAEYDDYHYDRIVLDNCEFVKRISVVSMDNGKGYVNGSAAVMANKPIQQPPMGRNINGVAAPTAAQEDGASRPDKKRRKVVVLIAVVTTVLLLMSILLMVVTIQLTPSIDERIRKEHEDLVRKMSVGVAKQLTNSSTDFVSHDELPSDNTGVL